MICSETGFKHNLRLITYFVFTLGLLSVLNMDWKHDSRIEMK